MLCPKCGAYSPYNTAVCNRCGSKLSADASAAASSLPSVKRRYYRNARPTEWQGKKAAMIGKANDTIDGMMADSKKRIILLVSAAVAAAVILFTGVSCVGCMCSGCFSCEESAASEDFNRYDASSSDVLPALPPLEPVSGTDSISDSDVISGADASSTDKVIIAC